MRKLGIVSFLKKPTEVSVVYVGRIIFSKKNETRVIRENDLSKKKLIVCRTLKDFTAALDNPRGRTCETKYH